MSALIHPACLDIDELLRQCETRRQRRSGPGGQHRNKVETGIFLLHVPTQTEAQSTERRSQEQNRKAAIFRLRIRLAVDVRTPVPHDCGPTRLWQSRCRQGRISINPGHDDFPAILSEALDVVAADNDDLAAAADRLTCTRSQLTKLIKLEPSAFASLNRQRQKKGLTPLR